MTEWALTLIGGLGVGSLLTTLLSHWIAQKSSNRELLYKEKRETYLGLLEALQRAPVGYSNENSKELRILANSMRFVWIGKSR
ncbi:MAG: hypothetical protein V4441_01655 [Pseudomonadota bacterium]